MGKLSQPTKDNKSLQISVDTLEEQLSIYKTAGKNRRSKLMKPWALFIVISSSINPSSASSLDVSFTAHPFILLQTTCTALANVDHFIPISLYYVSETVSCETKNLLFEYYVLQYYLKQILENTVIAFSPHVLSHPISNNQQ